jgi:Leucine rich repeat
MTADQEPPRESPPKRTNRRLRALLIVTALAFGLYVFAQIERPMAESLGPVGESVYNLFHPPEDNEVRPSAAARRFMDDIKALGGIPGVSVIHPGFLGIFHRTEWFNASFANPAFDDQALARLAELHGDRIGSLLLENTRITDAGLSHLKKMTNLRHLHIRNDHKSFAPGTPAPLSTITDAGLVHLKGLTTLWSLHLSDLPITDAGLEAIKDLPELQSLYLSRTKVQGSSLARLKSLPRLSILYLDGNQLTEDNLAALSGATSLQFLSLNAVPLTEKALPLLTAIPRLRNVDITGCGFLDEEVDALAKSKPGLKILRK